jgi:hypothetical protein
MKAEFHCFEFTDEDVVNPDDFIPTGEYNPHNVRPWLIYGSWGTLAVVFADCESDALDVAADGEKLEGYRIPPEEQDESREYCYLGNCCDAYDIQNIGMIELPNPKRSFVAEFNAHMKGEQPKK